MRILAVGDPHGDIKKIKKIPINGIDLVLITGDLGKADFARKFSFENFRRRKEGLPELEYSPVKNFSEAKNSFYKLLDILDNLNKKHNH